MFEWNNIILNSGIYVIAGTLLGFGLNEFTNYRKEKKEIHSVKTLFRLEIHQNLKLLTNFWENINKDYSNSDKEDIINSSDPASKIISLPFPQWKNTIWKNQASFLVKAFTEKEIMKIQEFYASLDSLKSIYTHILSLNLKDDDLRKSLINADMVTRSLYLRRYDSSNISQSLYNDFEEISNKLINQGNPILK